ncbi:hypothetical protein [Streptomyces sp. NBC_01462]|uniref:hypothetical protein n=1 Tax=Streptomyces sp. NBC_01462 TaxID=2903876 RepID=UPI002E331572|nr:hypothetical protein [Streptomyces sp. NBC_01462]
MRNHRVASRTLGELEADAKTWDTYNALTDGQREMPAFYPAVRCPNWWGAGTEPHQLHDLAATDGIPVAWVPPAMVLRRLVDVTGADRSVVHDQRLAVIVAAEADIRDACVGVVSECGDEWISEDKKVAEKVLLAWGDGHRGAAACLALACAEDIMFTVAQVDRKKKYAGIKSAASRPLSPILPNLQAALTPLQALYTAYYPEKNDPAPTTLSRHVVFHRLVLSHLNFGHCIIAIMIMASLLRQLQFICEDVRHQSEVDWA